MRNKILVWKWRLINWLNRKFPDPTKEQQLKDDAQLVKDFVNDKKQRERAVKVAEGLKRDFPHWFTVKQVIKKYNVEPNGVIVQLQTLSLFKLCTSKSNSKNEATFKILLGDEDLLWVIKQRKEEIEEELNQINKEVGEINKRIVTAAFDKK